MSILIRAGLHFKLFLPHTHSMLYTYHLYQKKVPKLHKYNPLTGFQTYTWTSQEIDPQYYQKAFSKLISLSKQLLP